MFISTNESGGQALGQPDMCFTPAPPGPPVPVPYVNVADLSMAVDTAMNVLVCGSLGLNLSSTVPMSDGDQPGVTGGVVSQVFMDEAGFSAGSTKVLIEGAPAVHLGASTTQNAYNCVGSIVAPSQTKVILGS
ncbi:PAAR-like domain-containing protein [Desulfovibrio inopinatus]|uniref:PAAR-like domain-containing protein n=1 Tax=Desulfovibrio inopinatus TaxID=102109 RepID=UPI00047F69AA|nr:PAAR-like domain-containing protein [Desulfovibrio inopinatus]